MSTIYLDQEKLAEAKREHTDALIKETQVLARRSGSAEDRAALAEIEAVLRTAKENWAA